MLEVIEKQFEMSGLQMQNEILSAHEQTINQLASKGVNYQHLHWALSPRTDRKEIALIFDSAATGEG